jgi:hypothetical protein
MKKSIETWSQYLQNKNVRPKVYNITFVRNERGEFEVVGRQAYMQNNMGGKAEWVNVDARDIARAIRNSGIIAK